jgi:predicted transcriptional regulator
MQAKLAKHHELRPTLRSFPKRKPMLAETGYAESRTPDISTEDMLAAESAFRSRREREEIFDATLFSDPAWDMLLDLYIARARGRRVTTSCACVAANCPPSTALRWLELLERQGLIERSDHDRDKRVRCIALTSKGVEGMNEYIHRSAPARSHN